MVKEVKMIGIDLGSNTLRAVLYDCETKKKIKVYEKIVATADGLALKGVISDEAVGRIIKAIHEMQDTFGVDDVCYAVTTQALRLAKNRDEVIATLYDQSGILFRIIDGDEEARLSVEGVKGGLSLVSSSSKFVMVDIGGGSTEVAYVNETTLKSVSLPLGILTLSQQYPTSKERKEPLQQFAAKIVQQALLWELDPLVTPLVATAGTPTTLAAMMHGLDATTYDPCVVNGTKLRREDIRREGDRLIGLPSSERAVLVGVGREDLILTGIEILTMIYEALGHEWAIVMDDGLREGAAFEGCHSNQKSS